MAKGEGKVEVSEGGPLMDETGKDFQAMLEAAKSGAAKAVEAKAPAKVEDKPVEKEDEPDEKVDDTKADTSATDEDDSTDDVETLKGKLKGLKSELARVRKQRSASDGSANELKERIANLEGQLTTLKTSSEQTSLDQKLSKLSDEQVGTLLEQWSEARSDARADMRQAQKDQDQAAYDKALSDYNTATRAVDVYKDTQAKRTKAKAEAAKGADSEQQALSAEVQSMFEEAYEAMPDLKDTESALWKAGKAEYDKYPKLMAKLGPLGELVAMSRAIAKDPKLVGGKEKVKEVVKDIENALEKSFNKGGSAPSSGSKPKQFNITSAKDAQDFEKLVASVKHG